MTLRVSIRNILTNYSDTGVPSLAELRETRPSALTRVHENLDATVTPINSIVVRTRSQQGVFYDDDWFELHPQEVNKFPHEFTWRLICKTPERRMGDILPNLPEEYRNKTPDLCFVTDDNQVHILEFGTKRLGKAASAEQYAQSKIIKYSPMVEYLIKNGYRCRLDVMIVTRNATYSTFPIDEETATAFCWRYMTAISKMDELKRKHPEFHLHIQSLMRSPTVPTDMTPLIDFFNENGDKILSKYHNVCFEVPQSYFSKEALFSIALNNQKSLNTPVDPAKTISIHDHVLPGGRIDHEDSISRFPLVLPSDFGFIHDNFSDIHLDRMPFEYRHVWGNALRHYWTDPDKFKTYNEPPEHLTPEEFVASLQNLNPKSKREKNRIEIPKESIAMQNLSLVGVWGKKFKGHSQNIQKRQWSQKHISSMTYTDDIQQFIDNFPNILKLSPIERQPISIELLEHATPDSKWKPIETYNSLKDNIYQSLLFIAELTREIACSISQSCSQNQFILKKLPSWDCLVLIKPSSSHQHTFFSLILKEEENFNVGHVFPTGIELGNSLVMYPFKSLQIPIIENALRLPEMYLACKYNCTGPSKTALLKNLACGLLLALDNKADAEEVMTKMRYIVMKGTTLPRSCRNPWLVLNSMTDRPRSRLTLFLLKRAIKLCSRVLEMKSLGTEDDMDHWANLPNFVSDDSVNNWEELLILMYTGYFRNKNSYTSGNQSMAMLEKITAPELEFQNDEIYKSNVLTGTALYPNKMEWNSGFLSFCIDLWERACNTKGMNDPKKEITDEFLISLSKVKTVELATLKASNVDTEEREYIIGKQNKKRKKVLLVMQDRISEFGPDMTTALPKALEIISERGGTMMISLFKKPQHAGLREIYVMDLASRIVQFCLELLGRIICNTLPSEAMTHPEVKLSYRQDHLKKVDTFMEKIKKAGKCADLVAHTAYDNDDAKKWNQYHHVQKFCYMLQNMTDERLHSFIKVGISMWRNKRIRMDDDLLNAMANSKYVPSSPDAQEIVKAFQGIQPSPLMKPLHCDISVDSGMMQGLLHFTSSVLHSLSLLAYNHLIKEYITHQRNFLREALRDKKIQMYVINTHAVTSDDSISANTIISNLPVERVVQHGLTACSALKLACSSMLGIVSSKEKASLCTAPISEFNSQWMDRKEIVRPKMRHILACFTYTAAGNFMEIQDNFSSLRQQALESGVCIQQVSLINFLQGLYFYRMAGSGSSPVFELMKDKLLTVPDPNAGFFMIDPPLLSGIASTDMNAYNLAQRSTLGAKYNRSYLEENILAGSSGSLRSATSLTIEFKNVSKYHELLRTVDSSKIREALLSNPELLFRSPSTTEESNIQIALKLMTPSVLKSLSKDYNCMTRELASSVYLFWAPIARNNQDAMRIITGLEPKGRKMSIFDIMNEQEPYILHAASHGYWTMTTQTKQLFFPLYEQYDMLNKICSDLENRMLRKQAVEPRSATSIEIIEGKFNEIPLMKLCAYKWFNLRDMDIPPVTLDIYWEDAKATYPFLLDDFQSTLANSGLDDPIQLKNAIDRTVKKGKIIRPTSRGGRGVRSAGTSTFISYNFKEGEVLKAPATRYMEDVIKRHMRRICMFLQIPTSDDVKTRMIQTEINKIPLNDLKHHPRFAPLALVHRDLQRSNKVLSLDRVAKLCRSHNTMIGVWIESQTRRGNQWFGNGKWGGYFIHNNKFARTEIILQNQEVFCITTDNLEVLQECAAKLNTTFRSWKVEPRIASNLNASTYFNRDFGPSHGCPVFVREVTELGAEVMKDRCDLQISNKQLRVLHNSIAIHEFVARSDLVAEGYTESHHIIDYIAENCPMPVDMVTKLLMSDHTNPFFQSLKQWFTSLVHKKTDYGDPEEMKPTEVYRISDLYEEMKQLETLSVVSSSLLDPLHPEIDAEMELAIATELDDYDERMRLFEYQTDCFPIVNSSHFMFLKNFLDYSYVLVAQINHGKTMLSNEDKFVYKLMTGKEAPRQADDEELYEMGKFDPWETSSTVGSEVESEPPAEPAQDISGFLSDPSEEAQE